MPTIWDDERRTLLYTVEEAAKRLKKSEKTVKLLVQSARATQRLYERRHNVRHANGRGGRERLFIDISTLGIPVPHYPESPRPKSDPQSQLSGSSLGVMGTSQGNAPIASTETVNTPITTLGVAKLSGSGNLTLRASSQGNEVPTLELARTDAALLLGTMQGSTYRDTDPAHARELHTAILPVLATAPKSRERGQQVRLVALARNVDESTVRDWVSRYERDGMAGLMPQVRRDRGAFRVPQETLQIICAAIISNPPTTSTRKLYQTLLLAVPDAMLTRRGGQVAEVSLATVARIREALLSHPQLRLMMYDADARKEFLRTYMGRVLANHANDLWQQDMTRCDTLVLDTETGEIYRPRVQAIIDVFSGAIPGLGFSRDEDQVQADLAFFRALQPKQGPLAQHYPIYGTPRRLYIDNGKTYSSTHFERIARELGIELIHSRPYVSHTRGAIERFFGTLHTFERTLPGYVGRDASDRGSEELKRLTAATRKWQETGRDPGEGQRLMTLHEYQSAVLRWLVVDYHQQRVDGKTRVQWFTETAPTHSVVAFDLGDLLIHFAQRVERLVQPDCTVRVDNVLWACPDGALGSYAGTRVLVLHDAMVLGPDVRVIAIRERAGHLRILGRAIRAPENALSIEAGDLRRANKLAKREALRDADTLRASIADPALMVRRQHERELPVVPVAALPAQSRGVITSVSPAPKPDLGTFGASFLTPDEPSDIAALLASLQEE